MEIDNGVASDATADETTIVEAPATPAAPETPEAPPNSAREAIDRAKAQMDKADREQPRSPDGKWTKEQQDAAAAQSAQKPAEGQPAPAKDTLANPSVPAPTRLSREAQAEWDKAPGTVRAEVDRAFREMQTGLQQYQERWTPLKQFDEMARAGGTDLPTALASYIGMENELRRDPIKGLAMICQNAGIDPAQAGQALAGMPSNGGATPEVAPLLNEIAALKNQVAGLSQTFEQRQVETTISQWAADKPHFAELREAMGKLMQAEMAANLDDAYALALRLHPPAQALAPSNPAAPAAPQTPAPQTRRPSLQIAGSGSAPSNGNDRIPGSPREAIEAAKRRIGGF